MKYVSLIPCILFYWITAAQSADTSAAILARQQAMQNLQEFNTAKTLPTYTNRPAEADIKVVEDDSQTLSSLGKARVAEDATAYFVTTQEKKRPKTAPNQHSTEMDYAEKLLEHPVSPKNVACAEGECDSSMTEESDDVNEGITRLGTLSGTADEVTRLQVTTGSANIFKGFYQECETYPLKLRDCCTDEGFLDGIISCPAELQSLQRAKIEHRVVYLGHYKPHFYSTTRYGFCVFPSKLAGIIQIQGRSAQLGIGFGQVKTPNCRGITPEELARLDFKRLDMGELVAEFSSKKTLPKNEELETIGKVSTHRFHQKGTAHD